MKLFFFILIINAKCLHSFIPIFISVMFTSAFLTSERENFLVHYPSFLVRGIPLTPHLQVCACVVAEIFT